MKTGIRAHQKNTVRKIIIVSMLGAASVVTATLFFNLMNPENARAGHGKLIPMQEQTFRTDFAIPVPEIRTSQIPTDKIIFTRPIKPLTGETKNANEK